jgi:homoserine kinase type II
MMTTVLHDDLQTFLSAYGITPRRFPATPLDGGGGNTVLLIEADDRKLVLRRYERIGREEVEFELQLARLLTERGLVTQPAIRRVDGALCSSLDGRPAALFEYVEGAEPVPGSPEVAEALALVVARMHGITRDVDLPHARAWTDVRALDRLEELAQNRGREIRDPLWPRLLDDCRELRAALHDRVYPRDSELPRGIIHHDLHPGNLLIDQHGELVLLDFDEAQMGWLALDLASLVRYWGMDANWEHIDPANASKLLAIYDAQRPLLDVEKELMPEMLLLFFLGDALGFIIAALARDPSCMAVTECHAYRRFRALRADLR